MNTTQHQNLDRSHLFLVRLWAEESRDIGTHNEDSTKREIEWCGKLQHVLTGEARTFHDWPMLIELLLEMAETDGLRPSSSGPGAQGGGARIQEATP